MAPEFKVTELDLYEILDILPAASEKEIKRAYRQKALKCHPDKNPDNPHAAEQWEKLSKALEILTDSEARAAYDKVLKARKAAELRNKALESKRRKIKHDLEAREAAFRDEQESSVDAAARLEREIKRLREEGSQTLKKEQEILKTELKESYNTTEEETPKLKVKWKSQKGDSLNGGYSYQYLRSTFQKYGDIHNLILSTKRNGSAIVEFSSPSAAELAVANEIGLAENPLTLTWLSGKPQTSRLAPTSRSVPFHDAGNDDFESLVLKKLQQAEERKKLEQEIQECDATATSNPIFPSASRQNPGKDTSCPAGGNNGGSTGDDFESAILRKMNAAQSEKRDKSDAAIPLPTPGQNVPQFKTPSKGDGAIPLPMPGQSIPRSETQNNGGDAIPLPMPGQHIPPFSERTDTRDEGTCEDEGCETEKELSGQNSASRDFESLVMMQMRQAEERKRLIEQLKEEDDS